MTHKDAIHTDHAPAAIGPYSQAIRSGDLVFCSGQIPINPRTGKVDAVSTQEQATQVMENLGAVLKQAGLGYGDVLKTTIFLQDMGDFGVVNEVYGNYFQKPYPARATIQVAALPLKVKVEIDAIARG